MSEELVLSDRTTLSPLPALSDELTRLYSQGFLTDVTLSTEDGKNFEAHRILLAARSNYFRAILPRLKSEPVVFLKGIKGAHLDKVIKFIYGAQVSVSRHQLKSVLEVARILEVKGLKDMSSSDVAALTRSSQNAAKFGHAPPNFSVANTRSMSNSFESNSSSRIATPTFKSPTSVRRGRASLSNGADNTNEAESESSSQVTEVKVKRKRGRPPKNKKVVNATLTTTATTATTTTRDAEMSAKTRSNDPYEFEENESGREEEDRRRKEGDDEQLHNDSNNDDDDRSRKTQTNRSGVNGKQVLTVKCKGTLAELYVCQFASGSRGHSIRYNNEWMTPQEFEMVAGGTGKKCLDNITTDYGPLKSLMASGLIKTQAKRCRCDLCCGEQEEENPSTMQRKRRIDDTQDDEQRNDLDDVNDDERGVAGVVGNEEEEDEDDDLNLVNHLTEDAIHTDPNREHVGNGLGEGDLPSDPLVRMKRKKKKHHHRDDWKKQLTAQLKTEAANQQAILSMNPPTPLITATTFADLNEPQTGLLPSSSPLLQHQPTFSIDASKLSSPSLLTAVTDQHQPPPQQPTTIYVMSSPHPHMSAPPTPHHNPFATIAPPPMSPALSIQTSTPQYFSQPTITKSAGSNGGFGSSNSNVGSSLSRIGNILNVRCKSMTALMYVNKYESGSKGKCIQLDDEWLTPNEFEDRAGSKAKKYLSSIKYMGRPLRVYVNSGELRGSGASPSAVKINKQTPLAPAPSVTPVPPAPSTPTHMSGTATPLPANLNMVMTSGASAAASQTPILINNASAMTAMGTGPNMIPTMTFAIAQPVEVRQQPVSSQAM